MPVAWGWNVIDRVIRRAGAGVGAGGAAEAIEPVVDAAGVLLVAPSMSWRDFTAVVNSVPSRRNGIDGTGVWSTFKRSSKIVAMVSSAEIVGFSQQTGKKSMVLEVRSDLVSTIRHR